MGLLDFFKKKNKKKIYSGIDTLTFRDNYSTLSDIYRNRSYSLNSDSGTIFLDLVNFNDFWDKYIINHKRYLDKYDQSFVTIRIVEINNNNYLYKETIREVTELSKKTLVPLSDSKPFSHFSSGLVEIGFWDFNTGTFDPVWSAKYTS